MRISALLLAALFGLTLMVGCGGKTEISADQAKKNRAKEQEAPVNMETMVLPEQREGN